MSLVIGLLQQLKGLGIILGYALSLVIHRSQTVGTAHRMFSNLQALVVAFRGLHALTQFIANAQIEAGRQFSAFHSFFQTAICFIVSLGLPEIRAIPIQIVGIAVLRSHAVDVLGLLRLGSNQVLISVFIMFS